MKANERISDVIGALQVEDQPCRRVQHRLESVQEVGQDADQHADAVVQQGVHQKPIRRPSLCIYSAFSVSLCIGISFTVLYFSAL